MKPAHQHEKQQPCDPQTQALLDRSVHKFRFSERVMNCFRNKDIRTIRELVMYTEDDLMDLPNFGEASLAQVKEILCCRNLALRQPD